jgi:hypothetical protein
MQQISYPEILEVSLQKLPFIPNKVDWLYTFSKGNS